MARFSLLFSRLFTEPTDSPKIQFLRYGLVAGMAFVFDFGLLYIFTTKMHIFYLLSATLSFTISAAVNYFLSTLWVLTNRIERQRSHELLIFTLICAIALGLNDAFIWLFTSVFALYYLVSKLLTVCIVFFWSFAARRFFFANTIRSLISKTEG